MLRYRVRTGYFLGVQAKSFHSASSSLQAWQSRRVGAWARPTIRSGDTMSISVRVTSEHHAEG